MDGQTLKRGSERQPDEAGRIRARELYEVGEPGVGDRLKFRRSVHPQAGVPRPLDTLMSERPWNASLGVNGSSKLEAVSTARLADFVKLARTDSSGLVRLALASTLQRLPVHLRAELGANLVVHPEDAADHNLPLLTWYGLIPVANADPMALARLSAKCEWPMTRRFIARRLAEDIEKKPAPADELLRLTAAKSEAFQADILGGLSDGLTGWRSR